MFKFVQSTHPRAFQAMLSFGLLHDNHRAFCQMLDLSLEGFEETLEAASVKCKMHDQFSSEHHGLVRCSCWQLACKLVSGCK